MKEKNKFEQVIGYKVENWHGVEKPALTILEGNFCTLEPIDLDKHAKKIFENLSFESQGESWTYLPYGPFTQLGEFCDWLKATNSEIDTQLYAILDKELMPVWIAGYLRINPEHGVIEVGHLHYSKLLQRTPATTEAMYLMMCHAFDTYGYRRYEWKCNSLNEPSRNAALRLGFKFEGTFRQSNVFKNYNRDTDWFSILNSEWSTVKKRLQHWLMPKNFDANGNQILRLNDIDYN